MNTNDDALKKSLEAMIPKNLDDIVRQNRDLASLSLATDEEIQSLYFPIEVGSKPIKDFLEDWNLISLKIKDQDPKLLLIGDIDGSSEMRISTEAVQIDMSKKLLITKNGSLYQFGKQLETEPNQTQLMFICSAFHGWGFGPYFGTPHFFF